MRSKLQELADLKSRLEHKRQEGDQASGALKQLMKQLKDEFGCDTLEEAEKKLAEMQADVAKKERKFDKKLDQFNKTFGAHLD